MRTQSRITLIVRAAMLAAIILILPGMRAASVKAVAATSPTYSIVDLGHLPGGSDPNPMAINNSGVIVGSAGTGTLSDGLGHIHPFLYDSNGAKTMVDLRPGDLGGAEAAVSINDAGMVVGTVASPRTNPPTPYSHAFTYDSNGDKTVHVLPDFSNLNMSPNHIGGDGKIVGDAEAVDTYGRSYAVRYDGSWHDLGPQSGYSAVANGSNTAGQVVGYYYPTQTSPAVQAILFDAPDSQGGIAWHDLGNTLGGGYSDARFINDNGLVVGEAESAIAGQNQVFTYDTRGDQTMHAVPLSPGYDSGQPTGLNNKGQVVGTEYSSTTGVSEAFFYDGSTTRSLASLVPSGSPYTLSFVHGINDKGQIIVQGQTSDGALHALLLTSDSTQLSIGNVNIARPATGTVTASFPVSLSSASQNTVTVHYASKDGTATSGKDYTAVSGTLTFNPGQTSATIPVTIQAGTNTGVKTFTVQLSGATNATITADTGTGTIRTKPAITALDTKEGSPAGGTSVGITGTGFSTAGDTSVYFGTESAASVTCDSTTHCVAVSPPGQNPVHITVSVGGVSSDTSNADLFTYAVRVTAVTPARGKVDGGDHVQITGAGFGTSPRATSVQFGNLYATDISCPDEYHCSVTTPAGTGAVHVTAIVAGMVSAVTDRDLFRYGSSTLTATDTTNPSGGPVHVGDSIHFTGQNWDTAKSVQIVYNDGRQDHRIGSATLGSDGGFSGNLQNVFFTHNGSDATSACTGTLKAVQGSLEVDVSIAGKPESYVPASNRALAIPQVDLPSLKRARLIRAPDYTCAGEVAAVAKWGAYSYISLLSGNVLPPITPAQPSIILHGIPVASAWLMEGLNPATHVAVQGLMQIDPGAHLCMPIGLGRSMLVGHPEDGTQGSTPTSCPTPQPGSGVGTVNCESRFGNDAGHIPAGTVSTADYKLSGILIADGNITFAKGLELDGGVICVRGNLTVKRDLKGAGAIFSEGSVDVTGPVTFRSDDQWAFVTHGDLFLRG